MSLLWRRSVVRAVLALFAILAVAGGALAWRLAVAPIPLPFLDPRIEEALSGLSPDVVARIDHTELGWVGHWPELRILGVSLARRGGEPLLRLPSVGVLPSLRALARGRFVVHRVHLSGLQFMLVRDGEGTLKLAAVGGGEFDPSGLLVSGGSDESPVRSLQRIRMDDAALTYDDRPAQRLWRADHANLEVTRQANRFDVHLDAAVSLESPASEIARAMKLPIALTAEVFHDAEGRPAEVVFRAKVNAGSFTPAGKGGPPLAVSSLAAEGGFSSSSRRFDLRKLHASAGSGEIDLAASVSADRPSQGLELRGELRSLPIAELHRWWPPRAATAAREWIVTNVRGGVVPHCRFAIKLPGREQPVSADAVDVRFDFEGLTVDYFRDLDPAVRVRGSGFLSAERFEARVTEAAIVDLRVDNGLVDIRFRGGPARLKVAADVSGPSKDVLGVIDRPPLAIAQKIGLVARELAGTGKGHVEVELPLKAGLTPEDVKVTAAGRLSNASLANVLDGVGIEKGDLNVQVDGRHVLVEGQSDLTGLPVARDRANLTVEYSPGGSSGGDSLRIDIDAEDTVLKSLATLDAGVLRSVSVTRLRFAGNDLSGEVSRRASGGYRVSVDGPSLDLEPLFRGTESSRDLIDKIRAPYDAEFRFQRVNVGKGLALSSVQGAARGDGGRLAMLNGTGSVGEGGTVRIELAEQGPIRRLNVTSDHAASLLKALGVFVEVEGGNLALDATLDDRDTKPARVEGRLDVNDFRLTRAPILAKVLSLGSLGGIASLLEGGGLAFSRARLPFTWSAGTVELKDATAVGAIGLTAGGKMDSKNRKLDLRGNVFPAYTLNSALGKIPFIGDFLVGGKGQGVFGLEYRVTGSADNPEIDVNPLSALAPGVLRRMFVDPFRREERPPAPHP